MKNLDKTFSWGFSLMKIVRAIVTVLCQYKGWFAWQNSNSVDSALATLRHCHPKNKLFFTCRLDLKPQFFIFGQLIILIPQI